MRDLASRVERLTEESTVAAESNARHITVLEGELRLVKEVLTARGESTTSGAKVRVPEPKPYEGARNAKSLENFLWDIETYFEAAQVHENEKVTIASMYLTGDAKLWWRTRTTEDVAAGRGRIETWAVLKSELKAQFLPLNSSWPARDAMRKLEQTGTIRDYVTRFSSLLLDVRNMSEADKLFNVTSSLKPWRSRSWRDNVFKTYNQPWRRSSGWWTTRA